MNLLDLLVSGGPIMLVIGAFSILAVAVTLERWVALRRGKVLPRGLRRELRRLREPREHFAPQELFALTERYRCCASRVIGDMLGKLGRPLAEVDATIAESTQREADALYGNVRWLTLTAAVSPLIGLLGTVWGMIIAFHDTTQLTAGSNRAEFLAEGIYIALVTTLGGLVVAIPAAIAAHYFEGRILRSLADMDRELRGLLPRFELFEGKARYDVGPRGLARRDPPDGGVRKTVIVEPPLPAPSARSTTRKS